MKNKVRKAAIDDIAQLTELFDAYRVFYEKDSDKEGAKAFLTARILNKESEIFVAMDQHKTLTGFVQLYPIFSSTRMQRLWLLNDLFVKPEFRGQGFSIALIESAKTLCRNTNAFGLLLETAKTNTIGNSLYPRTGFILDKDHNYYTWEA